MTPIKSRPLIDQVIEELDAFLLSDDGLENAMDVSGLDGFLCAVLSGRMSSCRRNGCGEFGILRKASSLRSLRARSNRNASLTY
jgi:hypothetical protein